MIENTSKKKKGFTLVELIVVIAIIGILAAISVPKYSAYKENANIKADEATAKLLAEATLMAYDAEEVTKTDVDTNGVVEQTDVWKYMSGTKGDDAKTGGEWVINITRTDAGIDKKGTITVTTDGAGTIEYKIEY